MSKIAVIDTGINILGLFHPDRVIARYCIKNGEHIKTSPLPMWSPESRKTFWSVDNTHIPYGHGTLCAQVLEFYSDIAGEDYTVTDIQLWDESDAQTPGKVKNTGCINNLHGALQLCLSLDIDIISMSLGSYMLSDSPVMGDIIRALYEAGIIMVAACDNCSRITIPASYPEVIGVRNESSHILKYGDMVCNTEDYLGIQVTAAYAFKKFTASNSLTVPIVVSRINQYMNRGITGFQKVIEKLTEDSPQELIRVFRQANQNQLLDIHQPRTIPHVCVLQDKAAGNFDFFLDMIERLSQEGYESVCLMDSEKRHNDMRFFYYNDYKAPLANILAFLERFTEAGVVFSVWDGEPPQTCDADVMILQKDGHMCVENDNGTIIYDSKKQGHNLTGVELGELLHEFIGIHTEE